MNSRTDPVIAARKAADEAWHTCSKAEREWQLEAEKRSPERWRQLIDRVRDGQTRAHLASIIWWDFYSSRLWWDFYSSRPANDPWQNLADLLEAFDPQSQCDMHRLRTELRHIGYPRRIAARRGRQIEQHEEGEE